ncbi:winged helix-turn-helix domain-containing protein [Planctobacterium marinum]|uniref:OmpR/PhoB-type domain-containing protein n=1 Tax=Planctobacterium marinum TaxID=1631968 RepID=A0AA48I1F3_9ALTE|nr:hypothetical protein MACH26_40060 [Planctobacterium marinum]
MPDETISKHIATFPKLYFGQIQYLRNERELLVEGETIRLEPKAAATLEVLLDNHNSVVTREQLLDEIWGQTGSDEALTQAISRLRRLFGDAINIKTIPKIGYQLLTKPETTARIAIVAPEQPVQPVPVKPLIDTPLKGFVCGFCLATLIALFIGLLMTDIQISVEEEYDHNGKVSGTTTIEKCREEDCS